MNISECRHSIYLERARPFARKKPVRKLLRGSDGRAVLALVTRLRKKLRALRGWGVAPGAPGAHPLRRALSRGVLSPTRAYSALKLGTHPQSCAVSTHRPMKAPRACKLVAPAPALAPEPLRPNTTWHASELHVHSRSCESPVRARTGACERELARDRNGVACRPPRTAERDLSSSSISSSHPSSCSSSSSSSVATLVSQLLSAARPSQAPLHFIFTLLFAQSSSCFHQSRLIVVDTSYASNQLRRCRIALL